MPKLGTEIHRKALATDKAWSVQLTKLFGKNAGDVRYTKEGQGAECSLLRKLYDARKEAQQNWYND
jgi:hypothetical protein